MIGGIHSALQASGVSFDMSGIAFPQLNTEFQQTVSEEFKKKLEQCTDDEARFALILEQDDSKFQMDVDFGASYTCSGCSRVHTGASGDVTPQQCYTLPKDKKFSFFDWFLPAGT